MPAFSQKSIERLKTCDPRLQLVFSEVIKYRDCTVLCGHRSEVDQNRAVKDGMSKTPWPRSKHNSTPSLAADVVPYPVDWRAMDRFTEFAGFVLGVAATFGVKLRWGGDWNRNGRTADETFLDAPHFELLD